MDSPITGAEVTKVVKKVHGARALGVLEFLKALDVVGLSRMTCLSSITWTSGADRRGDSPF